MSSSQSNRPIDVVELIDDGLDPSCEAPRTRLQTVPSAHHNKSHTTSFRDSISGPPARIIIGSQAEEFIVHKNLLCASSGYFEAALNGRFMENINQTIVLDDEDPQVFCTFVAWLYQGKLSSSDIRKVFPEADDFEDHITATMVFAEKRDILELFNDTISMLLSKLGKTGLARLLTIKRVYKLAGYPQCHMLQWWLCMDELYFGHRITSGEMEHFPRAFVVQSLEYALKPRLPTRIILRRVICRLFHSHKSDEDRSECFSMANNQYDGPPTVVLPTKTSSEPSKKRRISP